MAQQQSWAPVFGLGLLILGGGLFLLLRPGDEPSPPSQVAPAASEAPIQPTSRPAARPPSKHAAKPTSPLPSDGGAAGDPEPSAEEATAAEQLRAVQIVDRGQSYTEAAMKQPPMGELEPSDPNYDAEVEAQQLFHPFEQALREAGPLDPTTWKATLAQFRDHNGSVLQRAGDLRRAGDSEAAGLLLEEWSRLYNIEKGKAYGRTPPSPGGRGGEGQR